MLKKILFLILIQVSVWSSAQENFRDAMKLFKDQKYNLAYIDFKKSEYPKSFFYLGMMNLTGKGVDKNLEKAKEYWELGHKKNDVKSSISLALSVIREDVSRTISILESSSNTTNSPLPMFEVSKIYADKALTIHDFKKAFDWSLRAAKLGHTESQANLGIMYYYGDGVDKNINESIKWYTVSANDGFENSQYALGIIHLQKERPEYAIEWLEKAAKNDHLEAILTLSDYYQFKEKNNVKAESYLNKAIFLGYKEAKLQLGIMYLNSASQAARERGIKVLSNCLIADKNKACSSPFISIFMHNKYRKMIQDQKYINILNKI